MLEFTLATQFTAGTNLSGEISSADWRFLLPRLQMTTLLCIGGPSVKPLTVLARTCDALFVLSDNRAELQELREQCREVNLGNVQTVHIDRPNALPFEDKSIEVIQVVESNKCSLARRMDFSELSRIMTLDGVICCESQTLRGRFVIDRKLRTLTGHGFDFPDYFGITPLTGDMRSAVPLNNRGIVSYFFAHVLYGQSRKKRALSNLGAVLSKLGLYRYMAPRRSVTVGRANSYGQSPKPLDYLVSLAKEAGIDLTEMSYGISARGRGNSNKIVVFLFEQFADKPTAVIKMTRAPRFNARLENEYRVLKHLQDSEFVDSSTYPEPLFLGYHNDLAVLCLRAVEGQPFRVRTEGTATCSVARAAIEWLVQLGVSSVKSGTASSRDASAALGILFNSFADIYKLSREEEVFLTKQIDAIGRSGGKFPIVLEHGDPGTWNMLVPDQAKVIVLDWEAGERQGMPLWDLLYFFRTYASWVSRMQGSRDSLKNFAHHFLEISPLGSFLREVTGRYCKQIHLDQTLVGPLFYTCWMHRALKEATRLPEASLGSGHYINLLRLAIAERNNPVLRRLLFA